MTTRVDDSYRAGWDNTIVLDGMLVEVHKPGFGRGCQAVVTKLADICEVELVHVGSNRAGWIRGNRVDIGAAYLEGIEQ